MIVTPGFLPRAEIAKCFRYFYVFLLVAQLQTAKLTVKKYKTVEASVFNGS
jgi:hypothetical protein